jgi:F0F1-type ATP synthase epsilon subunit
MALVFDIVGARGLLLHEASLERIVIRRREEQFDLGSEFAICPHHGPLLMQTQACRVRLTRKGTAREVEVPAGVFEVIDDRATLVVT